MSRVTLFHVEDSTLKKVAETFEKTEESLKDDVKKIEEWLQNQKELPETMDEKLIQNFLFLNKCKIDKTKEKIQNYYTVRPRSSNLLKTANPKLENMKNVLEAMYFVPLPKLTEEMYRVYMFQVRNKDKMSNLDPYDTLRFFVNVMEIRLHEDVMYGDVFIVDAKNVSLKFLLKLTPFFLYRSIITIYERVYSLRVKAYYIINVPPVLEKIIETVKWIKPKIADRIHACKDPKIVQEKIPKEILPEDYGGLEKSLEELKDMLSNKFEEYQIRFDKLDTF